MPLCFMMKKDHFKQKMLLCFLFPFKRFLEYKSNFRTAILQAPLYSRMVLWIFCLKSSLSRQPVRYVFNIQETIIFFNKCTYYRWFKIFNVFMCLDNSEMIKKPKTKKIKIAFNCWIKTLHIFILSALQTQVADWQIYIMLYIYIYIYIDR